MLASTEVYSHWNSHGGRGGLLCSHFYFFLVHSNSINSPDSICCMTLLFLYLSAEKPLPQGPPGGVIGILGGVVAIGLIAGVAVTVFMVHRRQQKTRTETDNDLWVSARTTAWGWTGVHFHESEPMKNGKSQYVQRQSSYYSFWGLIIWLSTGSFMGNNQIAPLNSEHVSVYSRRLMTVI